VGVKKSRLRRERARRKWRVKSNPSSSGILLGTTRMGKRKGFQEKDSSTRPKRKDDIVPKGMLEKKK